MKKRVCSLLLAMCLILTLPGLRIRAEEPEAKTVTQPGTRAGICYLLWDIAGQPDPITAGSPFEDVQKDSDYYKAVLWAVENNIIKGMNATTFAPDILCTRGQFAAFLWSFRGEPEPKSTESPFVDVESGAYYFTPVLWAAEEDAIEFENGQTEFRPDEALCHVTYDPESGRCAMSGEHVWDDGAVTPPTCFVAGYTTYTCRFCGKTDVRDPVEPSHDFSDWTVLVPATEESEGTEVRVCRRDNSHVEYRSIPKLNPSENPPDGPEDQIMTQPAFRGAVCYLLWAAAGQPEPAAAEFPFVDVAEDSYCYKAVLWAYNNVPQITNGMDKTHFGPDENCTKGQFVTFLWRTYGKPEPTTTECPFTDVAAKKFYYKPAIWAWENKVIPFEENETLFRPDDLFCCVKYNFTNKTYTMVSEHSWDGGVVTYPSCVKTGFTTYTCTICGKKEDRDPTQTIDHAWESAVTAPTCTEEGYTTDTCKICGARQKRDFVEPIGHDFGQWTVSEPATSEREGVEIRICRRDSSHVEYRAIPKPKPTSMPNPFQDVSSKKYYYKPVLWAVNHVPQITNGTSADMFSPDNSCTRGQIVTFLWRAMGKPEPKIANNPFQDVEKSAFYYKAVLWAVENQITRGTSKTMFSPDDTVTRGQTVTFLWRMERMPEVNGLSPFEDVATGAYYSGAVLWAVKNGVTNGTSPTTFSPDEPCTRGQIVSFLYRDLTS